MFCADSNPWDGSLLCELSDGHTGHHQAHGCIRWADRCHFAGDDCPTGTHHTATEATR